MTALEHARRPKDMDVPDWRLRRLKGDLSDGWAVTVNGNWRLVFRFENGGAIDVDTWITIRFEVKMLRMHGPAHPGEVLREYLPEGMSVTGAARRLGMTRQSLSAILNRRVGISADMALRLSEALGTSAEMWLSMRAGYDFWQTGQMPRARVEPISA